MLSDWWAFMPLTGAGQPDYFRHLEVFLGISQPLVVVGDWNAVLDVCLDYVGLDKRRGAKASQTSSNVSKCLTGTD